MAGLQKKNFESPDESMISPRSKTEIVKFGNLTLAKITFEPGWRWSTDVKPLLKTPSCPKHHFGYCISGRMGVQLGDGPRMEYGPGDVVDIPPGHDGWVLGDEPAVFLDFGGTACVA